MRPLAGFEVRRAAILAAAVAMGAAGSAIGAAHAAPRPPPLHEAQGSERFLTLVNSIRARGCGGRAGVRRSLREQPRLAAAARELARGATLSDAAASAGYRALSSVSIHISGNLADDAVARTLAGRFCAQLTDPALRDIGVYRRGSDLWIFAAAPFATTALSDPARVSRQVLDLVNGARAEGRRCGNRAFGPVPPLHLSNRLREAALAHSRDMAAHSRLDHIGGDGSTPAQRVTRTGYTWRAVGENIAAGPTSAREVAAGWLASPEHCANIMDPRFTETAVAYVVDPKSRAGVYWTEELAAPRPAGAHARR